MQNNQPKQQISQVIKFTPDNRLVSGYDPVKLEEFENKLDGQFELLRTREGIDSQSLIDELGINCKREDAILNYFDKKLWDKSKWTIADFDDPVKKVFSELLYIYTVTYLSNIENPLDAEIDQSHYQREINEMWRWRTEELGKNNNLTRPYVAYLIERYYHKFLESISKQRLTTG